MIISNKNEPKIELVWFGLKREDQNLRDKYLGWLNDIEITHLIGSPLLLNKDKGPKFIEESFHRFTQKNSIGFFINYVPDNIYIGTAKLDNISEHSQSAWDGIMIGDSRYHGRGIAVVVYQILLAYAFDELNLHRVNGGCNINNLPMIKTFKHIGYSPEGQFRDADFIDDKFSDHLYFGILKNEFIARNKVKLITK